LNPESADIRLRENEAFVKFMFTNLDIAESGKTIMTAAAAAIDSLQDVADKGVKISVRAGEAVGQRTNIYTEYPIVKNHGGAKSMRLEDTNEKQETVEFNAFPIPSDGIVVLNYKIPANIEHAKVEIFDLSGKLILTSSNFVSEESSIELDLTAFRNGAYICSFILDNKIQSTKKLIILK
jgi:hypothetical protein